LKVDGMDRLGPQRAGTATGRAETDRGEFWRLGWLRGKWFPRLSPPFQKQIVDALRDGRTTVEELLLSKMLSNATSYRCGAAIPIEEGAGARLIRKALKTEK